MLILILFIMVIAASMQSSRIDHAQAPHEDEHRWAVDEVQRLKRRHERRNR